MKKTITVFTIALSGLFLNHCEDKQVRTEDESAGFIAGILGAAQAGAPLESNTSELARLNPFDDIVPAGGGSTGSSSGPRKPAVTMRRVRYCTRKTFGICRRSHTPSEFSMFQKENVKDSRLKDTYLAVLAPASKNSIENIVFLSSGQQGFNSTIANKGTSNSLTGQPEGFRGSCNSKCASKTVYLDTRSLAVRLFSHPKFSRSRTLYVLVFDAQFNHQYNNKQRVVNSFRRLLESKVYRHRIRRVILGGSSRGGALSYRLAADMLRLNTFYSAKYIVEGFDATFIKNEELGSTPHFYDNPINSGGYKGRRCNLNPFFNRYYAKVALNQIVGGQEAAPLSGARGSVMTPHNVDWGWYRQTWVNLKHKDIGSNLGYAHLTVNNAWDHINRSLTRLGL